MPGPELGPSIGLGLVYLASLSLVVRLQYVDTKIVIGLAVAQVGLSLGVKNEDQHILQSPNPLPKAIRGSMENF